MYLPELHAAQPLLAQPNRILVIAEGFEARSLSWIKSQPEDVLFEHAIICKYSPSKKDRFEDMRQEVAKRTNTSPTIIEYNRFAPTVFEQDFSKQILLLLAEQKEVVIDISVMSKLLIMIIVNVLRDFNIDLRVVYTEPKTWKPSQEEYQATVNATSKYGLRIALSSIGVFDITRTPRLASVVMQNAPSLLIAFTSTNEQALSALFNEVVPSAALLINAKSNRESWREEAALQINQRILHDFRIYETSINTFDLLDYISVFNCLAEIYKVNCYSKRIIISPTGGKIHTIACALIKACCQDIHIEYPTPESYHFDDYSSEEINATYEICFNNFNDLLRTVAQVYGLNG